MRYQFSNEIAQYGHFWTFEFLFININYQYKLCISIISRAINYLINLIRWNWFITYHSKLRSGQWNPHNRFRARQIVALRWILFRWKVRMPIIEFTEMMKCDFFFRYVRGCVQTCSDSDACNGSPPTKKNLFIDLILILTPLGSIYGIFTR